MKYKVFLWIAALMVAMPNVASAYDFSAVAPSGQTLYYNIVDGHAVVTAQLPYIPQYVIPPSGALVIPDSVTWDGTTYAVTGIDEMSFFECNGLTSVVIGNEVTSIQLSAFENCTGLTSVIIGDAVTTIAGQAFMGCVNLSSVTIGKSVSDMSLSTGITHCFFGCTNLTSITVDTANTHFDSRDNCNAIIETATNTLVLGFPSSVVPNTVTSIAPNAFMSCSGLTSIVIPNSVTCIGANAFYNCTDLSSVTFGDSIATIGENAFWACSSITSIVIPGTVTTFQGAFCNCTGLTSVVVSEGVTTISNGAFTGCTNLTTVSLPSTLTSIGQDAFYQCSALTSMTIPNSVEIIETSAFAECVNLISLTLPNNLAIISNNAFFHCSSLTSLYIPNSVTYIGAWAFIRCAGLTSITIPNSVVFIGELAFSECTNLTSVSIGSGVITIGQYMNGSDLEFNNPFRGCTSLSTITVDANNTHFDSRSNCNAIIETVTNTLIVGCGGTVIPNTVTRIGEEAFDACANLDAINIPTSVTSIEVSAFCNCTGLTSLNIPNSVSSSGENAFWGCSGLTSVHLPDSLTSISYGAFQGCTSLISFIVPNAVTTIGDWAFKNCSNLRSLTIGSSVTAIEGFQFIDGCYLLDSVIMKPATPPTLGGDITYDNRWYTSHYPTFYVSCGMIPTYMSGWSGYLVSPNVYHYSELGVEVNLTVEANNNLLGTVAIIPQNGQLVRCSDSSAVILATAAQHYHFDHWSNGLTSNPATLYLDGDSTVIAYFAVDWYSIVGSSNNNARGTVTGSDTVEYLDTVTLVAVPNYGYHLDHWRYTKDNGGYENLYNTDTIHLAATRNKTATAYFNPNQYTITLQVDTSIHGTVTGSGTYNYLANRTIDATANYGYHFLQWSDGNTDNPRTISLTQDTILMAMFAPNEYTLTITSNDETIGTVTGAGVYEYLDTVHVTAVVTAEHYHFVRWNDGVTSSTRTVTILSNSSFTAFFAIDTHTVAATVNNDSYGTINGTGRYPYGATVNLEAVPEDSYYFVKWSNDTTDNPATFTCTGDTMLSAIFSDDVTPNLCMVSVQNNRNEVIWTKEQEVVEYKIYREGNITGNYDLVATVPYNDQSAWTDQESRPMSRSYRYKMTAVDSWGNESSFSDVHKTIHLIISQGMGNQWNLQWNEYEGAEFVTYMIYRGNQWGNLQLIGQISVGGNNSYTDENAPAGSVYYQVVVVKSIPCNITKSESLIYSNVATNDEVGITDVVAYNVNIRVADGRIVVEGAEGQEVRIYDMLGRKIRNEALPAGVYMVRVGDMPARRVVVMR